MLLNGMLQATMNSVMGEWTAIMLRAFQAPGAGKSPWSVVFRDALLRRLVLRFILCRAALTLHSAVGSNPANLPKVFPELPKEVSIPCGVHPMHGLLSGLSMRGAVRHVG